MLNDVVESLQEESPFEKVVGQNHNDITGYIRPKSMKHKEKPIEVEK